MEREYVIPLRKQTLHVPRYRRASKAAKTVREFLIRHMKTKEVRLGQELNMHLWERGIKNPPTRVKVKVVMLDDKIAKAELIGFEYKEAVKPGKKEKARGLAGKLAEKLTAGKGSDEESKESLESQVEEKSEAKVEKKEAVEKPVKKEVSEKPAVKKAPAKKAVKKA